MLTRLLFEVVYDFRVDARGGGGVPAAGLAVRQGLQQALEEAALRPPDDTTRAGALAVGANMPMPWESLDVDAWVGTKLPNMLAGLLVLAGQGGIALPDGVLEGALARPDPRATGRPTRAGMAQHPILDEVGPGRRGAGLGRDRRRSGGCRTAAGSRAERLFQFCPGCATTSVVPDATS